MAEITSAPTPGVTEVSSTPAAPEAVAAAPEAGENGLANDGGAISEAIRKFKLKMGGKEEEMDLTNEDHRSRLARMAQKGESADRKFNEAAMMRKQNEEFIRLLKTNPEAVLANPAIGVDVKEWAEKFLWQRLQEEKMTPEQKKYAAMEKELEESRQEKSRFREQKEREEFEKSKAQFKGKLESDIIKTLEASSLPKSPRTVARIAHYMLKAKSRGWKEVTPADVVDTVWKEYVEEHNQFYGALPAEKLKSILSQDFRKKVRGLDMEVLKQPAPMIGREGQPPPNPNRAENRGPKKITMDEWRERNRKLKEG